MVGDSARAIASGPSEIRTAGDRLVKRTEQQTASFEEADAALEKIATTVKDSSRRAEEAAVASYDGQWPSEFELRE